MDLEKDNIVVLTDDEGKDVEFDLLLCFDYEKKRYVAMLPVEPLEGVGEDEVLIYETIRDGGEDIFKPIENPVYLNEVFDEFQRLYEEELDTEEEEEDSEE